MGGSEAFARSLAPWFRSSQACQVLHWRERSQTQAVRASHSSSERDAASSSQAPRKS